MQIFDRKRTAQLLPYSNLVPALAQAAQELANGTITAPERQVVPIDGTSVLLGMPAFGPDLGVSKVVTVHAGNARHGLPAIQGEVTVFETDTGRRLALLDGPTVTSRRTAAMTLLGIETFASRRTDSVLLIGTGTQAGAHADALVEYFSVTTLHIAGETFEQAESFAAALAQRYPHLDVQPRVAAQLSQDVPDTDVVISLTTATAPVIPARLAPDTLVIGVGAFRPDMAEIPAGLLQSRPIIVDDLHGARQEAGDLIQARVDWSDVVALADVLSGNAPRPDQTPVFKTVGQAAWDLAAARVAIGECRAGVSV